MRSENEEYALQVIEEIKTSCANTDQYHHVLCKLILNKRFIPHQESSLKQEQLAILKSLSENFSQSFKMLLIKALHHSCYQTCSEHYKPGFHVLQIPYLLAWGYELRLRKVKAVYLNSIAIYQYSSLALSALWEALVISRIHFISGLRFENLSRKSWEICLKGIQKSSLYSLNFGSNYSQISGADWRLFWHSIKQSSIKHVNLDNAHFHNCEDSFWKAFFDGLGNSNLLSINLRNMSLSQLSTERWHKLYQAIACSKIESINLSQNNLDDTVATNRNNNSASWQIICNLIQLPALKNLTLLNLDSLQISDSGWDCLCSAFQQSQLEKLEFSADNNYETQVTEQRLQLLLKALKKNSLKTLYLHVHSAKSISIAIFHDLCDLLAKSNITSFVLDFNSRTLAFSTLDWQLLGECLKKGGINCLGMGAIQIDDGSNFKDFLVGLEKSNIKSLHLKKCNFNKLSSNEWIDLANFIQKKDIIELNLLGTDLDCSPSEDTWINFCHFIIKSGIRKLAFSVSYDPLSLEKVHVFCAAIQQSQLESFSCEGLERNMDNMSSDSFRLICTAINNSKIFELNHPWCFGKNTILSFLKREILDETVKIIQSRALFRKSLAQLCAFSLLNANAKLTPQGLELEKNNAPIDISLDEGQKEILKNYGIS